MQIWKNLPTKNVTVTEWLHKFTLDVLGKYSHNYLHHFCLHTIEMRPLKFSSEILSNLCFNLGDTVFGHDFNSLSGEGENHFESYNRIIGYFSKPKNLILSLVRFNSLHPL